MIRRITDKNLNDVEFNLANREDPQGRKIEYDPDFTIFYRGANPTYSESRDLEFNPDKKYYFKNDTINKTITASPSALHLYTFNGLDYIECPRKRGDNFEEGKTYYYRSGENNFVEANPRNQKLLESTGTLHNYYKVAFTPRRNEYDEPSQPIVLFNFDSANYQTSDLFPGVEEAFEWCKQNRENIKDIYASALEEGIKPSTVLKEYVNGETEFRKKRKNQNLTTRVANAKNVVERIRKNRTATPWGHPMLVASAQDNYNVTREQMDPATQAYKDAQFDDDLRKRIDKAQKEAYGYKVEYSGGKYKINPLRTPNTILGQHILNAPDQKKWYMDETLEGLMKKVNALQKILQAFKDEQFSKEELYEILQSETPSAFLDSTPIELKDSEVKDDEKLVPVYESLGVYKDEQSDNYIVNVKTPDGKLIRLGNFDNSRLARMASQAFEKANYDVKTFIESDFYNNHIENFKEFYKMYVEGAKKEVEEDFPLTIEKNEEGTYDIIYKLDNGETEIIKTFKDEPSAKDFIQNAKKYGDVEKYIEYFKNLSGTIIKGINKTGITKGVHNTKSFTYSDMKRIGEKLSAIFSEINSEEAEELLRGPREEHGKLYLKVADFVKEKLIETGFDKEQVESLSVEDAEQYQLLLSLQEILMRTVIDKLIKDAVQYVIARSISEEYLYNEEEFVGEVIRYIFRNITFIRPTYDKNNEALKRIIKPKYFFYKTKVKKAIENQ